MKQELRPYLFMISLLVVTSLALAYTVDVSITDQAGVQTEFPNKVGEWVGEELRFCTNPEHRKEWLLSELQDRNLCSECGSELDTMTIAERGLLPRDTVLVKNRYVHPSGRMIHSSIVLSGKDRASIHRPQVCLVGQGNEIVKSTTIDIPLHGREPLEVMVLDLIRRYRVGDQTVEQNHYYAYWFVGKDRETASHIQRMIWMGTDRIFRNVAHRWAYISVSGLRQETGQDHHQEVTALLQDLYPEISLIH
jgi:hypothetical protein